MTRVLDASGGDPTICLLFACLRSGISVTLTPSHTQGIVTGRSHSQRFSEDFWTPFLGPTEAAICLYISVSDDRRAGRDPFLGNFGHRFRPYFTGLENPSIDSAVQKFLP